MAWIVSMVIIASLMFLFTPQHASAEAESRASGLTAISQPKLLMILPLIVMAWVAVKAFSMPFSFLSLAMVSFVATPMVLLIPKWRNALPPLALLSVASVMLGIMLD